MYVAETTADNSGMNGPTVPLSPANTMELDIDMYIPIYPFAWNQPRPSPKSAFI